MFDRYAGKSSYLEPLGIAAAITTATALVGAELLLIIPIALAIAVIPLVARVGWRLLRSFVR